MKVTFEISDIQVLKVCALYPATDEQSEEVLAAVHETPELDLTTKCREDTDFAQLSLAVCAYTLSVIVAQKKNKFDK